jgi:hypothetical protein
MGLVMGLVRRLVMGPVRRLVLDLVQHLQEVHQAVMGLVMDLVQHLQEVHQAALPYHKVHRFPARESGMVCMRGSWSSSKLRQGHAVRQCQVCFVLVAHLWRREWWRQCQAHSALWKKKAKSLCR